MKFLIGTMSLFLGLSVAQADTIKPATLNITCSSSQSAKIIGIVSNASGAYATVDGIRIFEGRQLSAGTEGGDPYLQIVNGGYNITLYGGSFQQTFDTNTTVTNGTSPAMVWEAATDTSKPFTCTGTFGF